MNPFASITSDILARKGEARPWNSFGAEGPKEPLAWQALHRVHQALEEPPPPRIEQALAAPVVTPPDVAHVLKEEMAPPPKVARAAAKPVAAPPPAANKIKPPVSVKLAAPEAPHGDTAHHADIRKYTVKISTHDYERLGILAVKQGKSRQRLLQETVNNLFSGLTEEYGASCQCLGKCG